MNSRLSYLIIAAGLMVVPACDNVSAPPSSTAEFRAEAPEILVRGNPVASQELARVRQATKKYHDLENALADEYVDIGVFIPNMGHHFLNEELLMDGAFELERPELLVYSERPDGSMKLVAVEYATPRDPANPPPPPEGFTGSDDEWIPNFDFNIWTLHAWVWQGNPDGVFAPMNPTVP